MACDDLLSALGDDLLRRILYFAPFKEAVSTSVLSRRWGHLWRSSGAVNLAVRVPSDGERYGYSNPKRQKEAQEAFFSYRDAFVRASEAALAAADAGISRLTLHLEGNHQDVYYRFLHRTGDCDGEVDVVGTVVSHPAARRVEELRITIMDYFDEVESWSETDRRHGGIYSLGSLLPYDTLRVLDLTMCSGLTLPESIGFPRLAALKLRFCRLETRVLQSLIDAAPELAAVHLASVHFWAPQDQRRHYAGSQWYRDSWSYAPEEHECQNQDDNATAQEVVPTLRLRCLAATELVLEMCNLEGSNCAIHQSWAIEIEAPRLRSFTYKGNLRSFLLTTPAPDMVYADLHFLDKETPNVYQEEDTTPLKRMHFWQFLQNFSNVKILKIKVNNLEHIAAIGKKGRTEHLCLFPNVQRLELDGVHDPTSNKGAVVIKNLLRSCPALRGLHLKLDTVASDSDKDSRYARQFLERKDRLDYERSLDHFMRRRSSKLTISMNNQYDEVSDIPGMRGRSFPCLQTSLRSVGLQFRLDGSNCLGVRLIKFFAENANVLEEMSVDTGNRRLWEHINLDIERWMAPKAYLTCKNLSEISWIFSKNQKVSTDSLIDFKSRRSTFTVTPLQR